MPFRGRGLAPRATLVVEAGAVSVFVSIRHITTHLDVLSSAGHERSFGVEAVQT